MYKYFSFNSYHYPHFFKRILVHVIYIYSNKHKFEKIQGEIFSFFALEDYMIIGVIDN